MTYGPPFCTDPSEVRNDAGVFFRRLRASLGSKPLPYVWVPEYHADKERFHLHFAVGRFVKRSLIEDAWAGRGWVHIKLLGDLPVGSGRLEEARHAAGYLSKYVAKSFQEQNHRGRQRYGVAEGFQPKRVQVWGRSSDEVLARASEMLGRPWPERVWLSSMEEDWHGPPAVWAQWS